MLLLSQEAIMIKSSFVCSLCFFTLYLFVYLISSVTHSPRDVNSDRTGRSHEMYDIGQKVKGFSFSNIQNTSLQNLIYYGSNTTLAAQFNTESMMEKYRDPENRSKLRRFPRVICIGMFKAGTDALSAFLEIHPEIARYPGEAKYFHVKSAGSNYEDYLRRMPYSDQSQLTYEKSPQYATWPDPNTVHRIYQFDPSVKILFLVRDPVIRAVSEYVHKYSTRIGVPTFEEVAVVDGIVQTEPFIISDSIYDVIIRPWISRFSREQIHVVDGDTLISNPTEEMYKIETFLNIDHFLDDSILYYNATRGFFCFKDSTLGNRCLPKYKGKPHPTVSEDVVNKLTDFYKPHNRIFSDLINQTFAWS